MSQRNLVSRTVYAIGDFADLTRNENSPPFVLARRLHNVVAVKLRSVRAPCPVNTVTSSQYFVVNFYDNTTATGTPAHTYNVTGVPVISGEYNGEVWTGTQLASYLKTAIEALANFSTYVESTSPGVTYDVSKGQFALSYEVKATKSISISRFTSSGTPIL